MTGEVLTSTAWIGIHSAGCWEPPTLPGLRE